MKKMFAASLVAIMAVSAANAEIASVSYTDKAIEAKTGDITTLATTAKSNLTAAVNELAGKVGTDSVATVKEELQGNIDAVDDKADANTAAIAALDDTYATDTALTDGLALKQDKAKMLDSLENFSGNKAEYYPTVNLMNTAIADANNEVGGDIADLASTVNELSGTVTANRSAADTGIQEAKDAAAAAQADADANAEAIAGLDTTYVSESEMTTFKESNTTAIATAKSEAIADAAAKDTALETKITNAYTAADSSLKLELEEKITAASGSASGVADDLAAYQESNDAAVAAAKTQADKGVADAAAAKAAADAAQADADANAAAIEGLDTTYVSESEMTTFKSSNTTAIATAKSEAIADAKSAADATYQVKSSALSVGAANGAWTDLTAAAGYSTTGTHSLVLKNGKIQWEAVKYAE